MWVGYVYREERPRGHFEPAERMQDEERESVAVDGERAFLGMRGRKEGGQGGEVRMDGGGIGPGTRRAQHGLVLLG